MEEGNPPGERLVIKSFPVNPGGQGAIDWAVFAVITTNERFQVDDTGTAATYAPITGGRLTITSSDFKQALEEDDLPQIVLQGTLHRKDEDRTKRRVKLWGRSNEKPVTTVA